MKTPVVPIGNSRGIRIPRAVLDLCHIRSAVDVSVKGETIIIRPIKHHPRDGWEAAFHAMHERHEDQLLIGEEVDRELGTWEW
jgi:antitoxin MazE